jgi:hypothetical protein
MDEINLRNTGLFCAVVGVVVAVEHKVFAHSWRRNELARRTMGIATVMGLGLLWVRRLNGFSAWLLLLAGFGSAGAVVSAMYTQEWAAAKEGRVIELRERVSERARAHR